MNNTEKYLNIKTTEYIEKINSFFNDKKMKINFQTVNISEGMYFTIAELHWNGQIMHVACGGGDSPEYSQYISATRLYSLYCNLPPYLTSNIALKKILDLNTKKNIMGKIFDMNVKEAMQTSHFKKVFTPYGNLSLGEDILVRICTGVFLGSPFNDVTDNEKGVMLTKKGELWISGLNGVAFGANYQDSIINGFGDIWEKRVLDNLKAHKDQEIHILDSAIVNNEKISILLKNITLLGFKVYILDFYSEFDIPVCALMCVDNTLNKGFISLGSHPVFELALEKAIFAAYEHIGKKKYGFKNTNARNLRCVETEMNLNSNTLEDCDLNLIKYFVFENEPNEKYILMDDDMDIELLYFYVTGQVRRNEEKYYVNNSSLSEELFSVKIADDNVRNIMPFELRYNLENVDIYKVFEIKDLFDKIMMSFSNEYSFNVFKDAYYKLINYLSSKEIFFAEDLFNKNISITSLFNETTLIVDMDNVINAIKAHERISDIDLRFVECKKQISKYELLNILKAKNKKEDTLSIAKALGVEVSEEDYNNSNSYAYLLENIFYKPLWNFYQSGEYEEYLMNYFRKEENEE